MSKFTTEVRFICESYAELDESKGYSSINEVLDASYDKVFDFDYPIFDATYKPLLEKKILRHYYTREICEETVGLWKLRLCNKMNEIMPYYNKLYQSELIAFNPLYDIDYTRDYHKTNENDNSGSSSQTGTGTATQQDSGRRDTENTGTGSNSDVGWNLYNDTPQGGLTDIDEMKYLTTATKNTNNHEYEDNNTGEMTYSDNKTNTSNTTNNSSYSDDLNGVEDYLEHVSGTHGGMSMSKKIMEYRKSFLNIDMEIIDELKGLFFMLWE